MNDTQTGSELKMESSYRNSPGNYHLHHTMLARKFASSKYPKFYGTLGYFASVILLLVALLPHSGKFLSLLHKRANLCAKVKMI